MKIALLLAFLLPTAALAETFALSGVSGSGVLNNVQFTPAGTTIQAASTGAVTVTASIDSSRIINMTVTYTLDEINPDHSTGIVNLGSCSATWVVGHPATVACSFANHATTVGKHLRFRIQFDPGLDGDGFPNTYSGDTYSWTTANTMIFCPTQSNPCTCNGICNGSSCGAQGSLPLVNTCTCDCTAAACVAQSISAPSGPVCTDGLTALDEQLSWGTVPGASTYTIKRSSTVVCSSPIAGTSCTDSPGVGMWSYNVLATGSCTPAIGGTTLSGKTTATGTNAACPVSARYSVVNAQ